MAIENDEIAADMALAEAAAWLTELQGGERTPSSDAAFRAWLEASPAHARAFARVTDVWEVLPGAATLHEQAALPDGPQVNRTRHWAYAMAASIALALGVGSYVGLTRNPVYETPRGQQRALQLDDGSQMALNTDSLVEVDYSRAERRVRLDRGEVFFTVAKNAARPFIVEAGDEEVRAVGTSFVVRRDTNGKVAVTLLDGVVRVTRNSLVKVGSPMRPTVLRPGERLTVDAAQVALDRPRLETATAWRSGNVMFDDRPLREAVAEFNRYGATQIVLRDPRLGNLRISGVFSALAPHEFAELTASIHDLRVVRDGDRIELRKP